MRIRSTFCISASEDRSDANTRLQIKLQTYYQWIVLQTRAQTLTNCEVRSPDLVCVPNCFPLNHLSRPHLTRLEFAQRIPLRHYTDRNRVVSQPGHPS